MLLMLLHTMVIFPMGSDVFISSLCSGSEADFGQRLDGVPGEHPLFSEADLWRSRLKEFSNSRVRLIDSLIGNSIDACAEALGGFVSPSRVLRIYYGAGAGKSALAVLADQLWKSEALESCTRLKDWTLTFPPGVGFDSTLQCFFLTAAHLGSYEQRAGRISRVTKFEAAWRVAATRHRSVGPVLDSAISPKIKTLCSWNKLSGYLKSQAKTCYDGMHRLELITALRKPYDYIAFAIRLVVRWFRFILRFFRLLSSFINGRHLRNRVGKLPKIQRTFTVLRN